MENNSTDKKVSIEDVKRLVFRAMMYKTSYVDLCVELNKLPSADSQSADDAFDKMCDMMYPLSIIEDRFTGSYSGGKFTAWHAEANEIPSDVFSDDVICSVFWNNPDKHNSPLFGIGDTIYDAVTDLYKKMLSRGFFAVGRAIY